MAHFEFSTGSIVQLGSELTDNFSVLKTRLAVYIMSDGPQGMRTLSQMVIAKHMSEGTWCMWDGDGDGTVYG